MIRYTDENLWTAGAEVIVNPINVVGVMGRGIALVMRQSFPHMFEVYRDLCAEGALKPGVLLYYAVGPRVIVNLPTKRHWRDPSRVADIRAGLSTLAANMPSPNLDPHRFPCTSIAMPRLGCGSGGLDWDRDVRPLVDDVLDGFDVVVCDGRLDPLRPRRPARAAYDLVPTWRLDAAKEAADRATRT